MKDVKNNGKLLNISFDKMNDIYINYDDDLLNDTLKSMRLADTTYQNYKDAMTRFLKCIGMSFNDLINTIEPLQRHRIENNTIIEYDPNHSLLKNYYDKFINECRNNNNTETTIKLRITSINRILKRNGIKTPKIKFNIPNTQKKPQLLTNKDIWYILDNYCNIYQKALISFIASTGIRKSDALQFKINDFLEATYEYHKTFDLDEFLDKYQNNMVGYWEFIPQKTQKTGLVCKVCNSGESSNYIIESLRARIIAIDKINKKNNEHIKLDGDCALFSNKHKQYTGHITPKGITNTIYGMNKEFEKYKIKSLKDNLDNGEITYKVYKKSIDNLVAFGLHNLRAYFISVLRHYVPNRDISLIMEAHTSDIPTDKNYLGESSELFDEDTIRETYNSIEKYLTFNNNISISETNKLKKDYDILTAENERLLNENISLKNNYDELRTEQYNFNKELLEVKEMLENSPISKLMEQVGK